MIQRRWRVHLAHVIPPAAASFCKSCLDLILSCFFLLVPLPLLFSALARCLFVVPESGSPGHARGLFLPPFLSRFFLQHLLAMSHPRRCQLFEPDLFIEGCRMKKQNINISSSI